ncbi:MAG: amidohydrolase, partial [Bacteroidia bacterium]|nr:amidohydrolase [Bacteroidia bacterium]
MKYLLLALFAVTLHSCKPHKQVDLILYNGKIYTVDSNFSVVSAIVIDQGKIIETGYDDIT